MAQPHLEKTSCRVCPLLLTMLLEDHPFLCGRKKRRGVVAPTRVCQGSASGTSAEDSSCILQTHLASLGLFQGCWNLAVRCCGSDCDLPWADGAGSSARRDGRAGHTSGTVAEGGRRNPLLMLAPAFFKVYFVGESWHISNNSLDCICWSVEGFWRGSNLDACPNIS